MAFPDDIDVAQKLQTCSDDDTKGALPKMNNALGLKRNSDRAAKARLLDHSDPYPATPPAGPGEHQEYCRGANTISLSGEGRRSVGQLRLCRFDGRKRVSYRLQQRAD